MKKYIYLVIFASLIATNMSFTVAASNKKKAAKSKIAVIKKLSCVCSKPTPFSASSSGGYTTFTWAAVPGAVTYNFGGYYREGSGFSECTTNTSVTIPTNSGGTAQVRAICEGDCNTATCSSDPAGPITF